MAQSEYTKVTRIKLWLFRILDWICLFLPVIIYIIIALSDGGVANIGKVSLVGCVVISLILTLFNVVAQKHLRCPIWIILIGLFVAIKQYLLPLIVILAVTSVMDDLLFTPLIAHYKMQLEASKVYDARTEELDNGKPKQTS